MARVEIRPFDGDMDALHKLAYRSWMAEYPTAAAGSWPDFYTPAIARYYFDTMVDPRLLVAAYLQGELVGFLANIPREYRFRGRHYKGVISGMLAVRPDLPGVVGLLLAACLQGNREYGADFSLFTLEKNHKTIRLARALSAGRLGPIQQTAALVTMWPLVHLIDLDTVQRHEGSDRLTVAAVKLWGGHRPIHPIDLPLEQARPCRLADLPGVLALTTRESDQRQLVRVFDLPALQAQLNAPEIGGMLVFEHQLAIKGLISFSIYHMVNQRGAQPWAWIDLVSWEACAPQEKHALLAATWALCKERGCIAILVWTRQPISYLPFYRAGFFPFPRPMDLQAGFLNPQVTLDGVKGVFEQIL